MTAKEFLQQGWHIEQRIDKRMDERQRLMAKLTNGVQVLSGMPRGGQHDWTDTAVRIAELDQMLDVDIQRLCAVKEAICKAIDAVQDERYKRLLELRYRQYYSFERIACEMGYSYEWTRHVHKQAVEAVQVPENSTHKDT